MTTVTASVARVVADGFDPGLTPSNSGLPPGLMNWIRDLGSGFLGAVFIVLAIAFVIAALMWGVAKAGGHQRMQTASGIGVVIVLAAAFLAGGANALIAWAGRSGDQAINGAVDPLQTGVHITATAEHALTALGPLFGS